MSINACAKTVLLHRKSQFQSCVVCRLPLEIKQRQLETRFREEIDNCQLPTPPMEIVVSGKTEIDRHWKIHQNQYRTMQLHKYQGEQYATYIQCRVTRNSQKLTKINMEQSNYMRTTGNNTRQNAKRNGRPRETIYCLNQ